MNLYFQILTQNQTTETLRLLEWPALLQQQEGTLKTGHIVSSSAGVLKRSRFTNIERQVAKLRELRFNELEVSYDLEHGRVFGFAAELRSLTGLFRPSASSPLWFPSSEWPIGGGGSARNRRMNAKCKETALTHFNVSQAPTTFEVVLEFDTSLPPDVVLDALARWIVSFVPSSVQSLNPFGCCDAAGPEYFVRIESNVLMTEGIRMMSRVCPDSYSLLGERFDALHPLMFGRSHGCSGIASDVGEGAQVHHGDAHRNLAVVRLSKSARTPEAEHRASRWILAPKDAMKMVEPGAASNGGPTTPEANRKSRKGRKPGR